MKIWVEHYSRTRRAKGIAEIYVSGGAMKYETKTCIGRLYQKHLPRETVDRLVHEIEKTILRCNLLLSGWEKSRGARQEYHHAAERNIRIILESQIREDLKNRIYAK